MKRDIRLAFGASLNETRLAKRMTQEEFRSRSYVSVLERGLRTVTLDKVNDLAAQLGVHPLTLVTLTYLKVYGRVDLVGLQDVVRKELASISSSLAAPSVRQRAPRPRRRKQKNRKRL